MIKTQKDLPADCKKNIVYKISYNNYDASYIGQTYRQLKTRISDHWNNIQILDTECNYNKRLISEIINIKQQNNSINLNKD